MTHAVSAASKGDAVKPLHNVNTADSYADLPFLPAGGVASAKGFKACGIHAGFRADPKRLDFALVAADQPAACAAVFTTNVFCSAPVTVSKEHLDGAGYGIARAVAINSGIANAATGDKGLQTARQSSGIVADALGCPVQEVLVASTGVIGQHLQMEPFESGAPLAASALSAAGGADAARAIMTTDTKPKEFAVTFSGNGLGYDGCMFTVGGMAKGSGMIMPNMATMISVITTDAPRGRKSALHEAPFERPVGISFNKITVDSDTLHERLVLPSGKRCGGPAAALRACSLARLPSTHSRTRCAPSASHLPARWRSMAKAPRVSSPLTWRGRRIRRMRTRRRAPWPIRRW